MFSKETLSKYSKAMNYWTHFYSEHLDDLQVSISAGNSKIGHAFNVSIAPLTTCPNCFECSRYCYDIRDCIRQGYNSTTLKARAKNTALYKCNPAEYFRQIDTFLSNYKGKHKYFRWHVGGEIVNTAYALHIIDIARRHPDWTFWTYTKNYTSVNQAISRQVDGMPENLHIMFSRFLSMLCDNPYGMPEFCTVDDSTIKVFKADGYKWCCPSNCDICKALGRGCVAGETTYNGLH